MPLYNNLDGATICALASAPGQAGIAVIRISGKNAFDITAALFEPAKKNLNVAEPPSHSANFGFIKTNGKILDEVIVNFYKAPHSYTGENTAEIFCHGSLYIQQQILALLTKHGCRLAEPGEFTFRAFLNGKLDLSQAEAVADLIAADSESAHDVALKQLKGGFSKKIDALRAELLKFTSLIELELDFSEEDVEFADRKQLLALLTNIQEEIKTLLGSFALGNVLKKGIPVAITGKPNVGKSTLLNALLNEERALVSAIPGTTRDAIEDTLNIEGICFRFIDTAGLRKAGDAIESMGIEKTIEKIKQAYIILYVFDISQTEEAELNDKLDELEAICEGDTKKILLVANKSDLLVEMPHTFKKLAEKEAVFISAKRRKNINLLADKLVESVKQSPFNTQSIVVSNVRHYNALQKASEIIDSIARLALLNTGHELLAADLRRALHYLDEITGLRINNENVLDEIFSNFCIGK